GDGIAAAEDRRDGEPCHPQADRRSHHGLALPRSNTAPAGTSRGGTAASNRRTHGRPGSGLPLRTAAAARVSSSTASVGEYLRLTTASKPARSADPRSRPPPFPNMSPRAVPTRSASRTAPE